VIFGRVPTAEAAGATLAHALHAGDRALKKGRILDADDVAELLAAGIADVVAARLEPGELDEDAAAAAVASALAGEHVRAADSTTGRANLFAEAGGLVAIDAAAIHAVNAHDDAITCATLAPLAPVRRGDMLATIKIIPFATGRAVVAAAAAAGRGAIAIRPWRGIRAALLMTRGAHDLARVAEVQRARVASVGGALVAERVTEHEAAAVAAALRELLDHELGLDLVLMLGASAVMDDGDVIPAAIRAVGGEIERIGMPVDPGNLLVLGHADATSIIGVPGCARSPKRSGFDFVLERIAAGVPVGRAELAHMGVGGLLDDIADRPAPRASKFAAIVLAAGRSTRMGDNKLLALLDGRPLVRHAVEAALGSAARPVVVVTGNDADAVRAALNGLDVRFVHNADFAAGMATSLAAGIANLDSEIDGALICLGDMPRVRAVHLDAIVAAAADGVHIVVPTHERKRGNPVLLHRAVFADVLALRGDVGARSLIERHADRVRAVAIDDPAVLLDVDTGAQLAALRPSDSTNHA
jgi:molybdenum cofactor cytidylyltransferase